MRGYHFVDFEFSKLEYFESRILEEEQKEKDGVSNFTTIPSFQDTLNILRDCVDDREILGSAIFTIEGKVLYSSISHSTLLNIIKEFEVRNEKKLHRILRMFLELRNHQKVCSEYIIIHSIELILILLFSENVNFAIGNMHLRDLANKLKALD